MGNFKQVKIPAVCKLSWTELSNFGSSVWSCVKCIPKVLFLSWPPHWKWSSHGPNPRKSFRKEALNMQWPSKSNLANMMVMSRWAWIELVHKRGRLAAWRLAFSAQLDGGEEDCAASLRRVYLKFVCCFPENNLKKKKNCSALESEALTFRNHWRKSEPHRTSWCRMKCAWNECNVLQGKNKTWQIWWILPLLLPSVLILRVAPASGKIAKMWTRKYGQISGHSNIHKLVHPQHQKLQDFFGKWRCVVISYSFRIFCQACDLKRNIGIQAKLSCSFFSLREKYWMLWGGCWGSVCPTFVSSC